VSPLGEFTSSRGAFFWQSKECGSEMLDFFKPELPDKFIHLFHQHLGFLKKEILVLLVRTSH